MQRAFPAIRLVLCGLLGLTLGTGCASSGGPAPSSSPSLTSSSTLPLAQAFARVKDEHARRHFVEGLTRAQLEDYEAAVASYEAALEAAPGEAAILSALADAKHALGDASAAVYYAEQARHEAAENIFYYQRLARLHHDLGHRREAAQAYEALLRRFPEAHEARFELARLLIALEDYGGALRTYETLIEHAGDTPAVRLRMLEIYRRTGDATGTERALQALIRLEPEEAAFRHMLGALYQEQGRAEAAVAQYKAALRLDAGDVEAAVALADLLREARQEGEAEALLEEAFDAENATADQLVERARPFYRRAATDADAADAATRLLRRALAMEPSHGTALALLGDLRYYAGAYDEAARLLDRALEHNPRDLRRWARAAAAHLQADRPRRAAEVAGEGLMLFPAQVPLLRVAAYGLMQSYQNDDAIARFREMLGVLDATAASEQAQRTDLYAALGLLYSRKKDYTASDSFYAEALNTDAENALALNNYAYSLAERGVKLDRALNLARRAVDLEPENPSFLDTLGWVYFKKGRLLEAEYWLHRAAAKDEAGATVFEHYGDVVAQQGRHDEARRYWQRALKQDPDRPSLRRKLGMQRD